MQVGATYSAVSDMNNGVLGCRNCRLGHVAKSDRSGTRPQGCFHFLARMRLVLRGVYRTVDLFEIGRRY